jgi:hypothetical protein
LASGILADAWEPTRASLEVFRPELKPHVEKFIQIYEPIRHKYFAHRGKDSEEAIWELFKKTAIAEVADILRFSYGLVMGINDMAWNATPPGKWTSDNSYDNLFTEYADSAESLIGGLK